MSFKDKKQLPPIDLSLLTRKHSYPENTLKVPESKHMQVIPSPITPVKCPLCLTAMSVVYCRTCNQYFRLSVHFPTPLKNDTQ